MQLDIPEGAQVQIIIGERSPMLALPDARLALASPPRRRRPILTAVAAGIVLIGAYQFGKHSTSGSAIPAAQAEPEAAALAVGKGGSAPVTGDPTQVPSAFAQQLRQAPTVVPPPGQPQAAGATDAFGLHH